MGAALRSNPPLRRLLAAWLQSCVGTGAGYVALLLLTVRHLHTPWAVAAVLLADFLPAIVLGTWFGALADRLTKRGLIVAANLIQAGAWAALVFATDAPTILAFALLAGTGHALQRPAVRSALPIVAGDASQVAAAMFDTANWIGQTIGPLLAAGLFALSGVALPLAVNAVSFVIAAAVFGTIAIARPEAVHEHNTGDVAHGVRAGLRAALTLPGIAALIAVSAASFVAAGLLNVSEPWLALRVLHANASEYALLVASYCCGMVAASVLVAGQGPKPAGVLIRRYVAAQLLTAVGMGGSALVGSVLPAVLTFAATGYGNSLLVVSEAQLIQLRVPTAVQGRLYGFKNTSESSCFLVGLLGAGALIAASGVRIALATGGVICACCSLVAAVMIKRGDAPPNAARPVEAAR